MKSLAVNLFQAAFALPRAPRSRAYQNGCYCALQCRFAGGHLVCPHPPGSTASDAWYAGTEEGAALYRIYTAAEVPVGDATLTTDHAASSYGIPVLVLHGHAYGPGDVLVLGREEVRAATYVRHQFRGAILPLLAERFLTQSTIQNQEAHG